MEYFLLTQDERITQAVTPIGLAKAIASRPFAKLAPEELDELPVQVYIKETPNPVYPDLIQHSETLVTDRVKTILEKYDSKIFFKPVVLADLKRACQELYWLMVPRRIACLAPHSEFRRDQTLQQLVLDPKKAGRLRIFAIDGIRENHVAVRLDVAESLLRRGFLGIKLQKVPMSDEVRGR